MRVSQKALVIPMLPWKLSQTDSAENKLGLKRKQGEQLQRRDCIFSIHQIKRRYS